MSEEMKAGSKLSGGLGALVPTNWCDPLLTGKDGLGPQPWGCPQIEKLLRGIKARIDAAERERLMDAKGDAFDRDRD